MADSIKKKLPHDNMKISEIEAWLNGMASNGLALIKLRADRVEFEKCEPQEIRYRIVHLKGPFSTKRLETYKELGYERVSRSNEKYEYDLEIDYVDFYVFKCVDQKQFENGIGDEVTKYSIKDGFALPKISAYMYMFISLLWIWLQRGSLMDKLERLEVYDIYSTVIFLIFWVVALIACVSRIIVLKYEQKKTYERYELNQDPEVKLHNKKKKLKVIYICFAVIFFIGLFISMVKDFSEERFLGDDDNIITIFDIDDSYSAIVENKDVYYFGKSKNNLFIKEYYKIQNEIEDDEIYTYLEIEYFDFRFANSYSWIIKYSEEYMQRRNRCNDEVICIQSEYFDQIVYYTYERGYGSAMEIFLYNEREFISLDYTGNKSPEEIIKAIENKLG